MSRALTRGVLGLALSLAVLGALFSGCNSEQEVDAMNTATTIEPFADLEYASEPLKVHLSGGVRNEEAWTRLRSTFAARNPGYDIAWESGLTKYEHAGVSAVLFVQGGTTTARVGARTSSLGVGDLAMLRANQTLLCDDAIDVLIFSVPESLPDALPSFVRPDQDPRITDTPGGCAEDIDAYRRILLTWRTEVGPYVFHALNAHRVRIFDSFTHFHPPRGGFDEFYLVQGVRPEARLITSAKTARIVKPDELEASELDHLLVEHELAVDDLVYLPRGTIHRGVGGVLTQVITIPGFRPGAEIGVDHFLARANRRFPEHTSLPLHAKGADQEMIK